jgi:hypothetical protein
LLGLCTAVVGIVGVVATDDVVVVINLEMGGSTNINGLQIQNINKTVFCLFHHSATFTF